MQHTYCSIAVAVKRFAIQPMIMACNRAINACSFERGTRLLQQQPGQPHLWRCPSCSTNECHRRSFSSEMKETIICFAESTPDRRITLGVLFECQVSLVENAAYWRQRAVALTIQRAELQNRSILAQRLPHKAPNKAFHTNFSDGLKMCASLFHVSEPGLKGGNRRQQSA